MAVPSATAPRLAPRAGLAVVLAVAIGIGLYGLYGYVDQYLLYRGFGPPVSTVPQAQQGRIVTLPVTSAALGGRTERVLVYLPAGYTSRPARRYPVVYLLHGTPGDPRTAFVNSLHVGPRMDALVASGAVRPMILAMPPGSPSTYDRATEWANGAGAGQQWFTYLTRDVVRAVDRHFRTVANRAGRGIAGYSSGADAAVNALLLRPSRFSVAEAWSGDFRQTPATVGRVPGLVRRFSALDSAPLLAAEPGRLGAHAYLYAGVRDRALPATLAVGGALSRAGVHTLLDVTAGGHAWMLWASRLDGALRYFSDHLRVRW
jgi:enterochelin esterase-like enzyme